MKKTQQRRIVLTVASLSLGVVLLVAIASRDGIARYYYLHCLRQDPSRLEKMLLGKASEQAAARGFMREPRGKQALFRVYLAEYDNGQPGFSNREFLERLKGRDITHGSLSIWAKGYSCQSSTGRTGGSSFSLGNTPENPARRELILELLDACVGPVFRLDEFPHLEFQIRPVADGKTEPPVWIGAPTLPPHPAPVVRSGVTHVCYYRVVPTES